jgi:hypothetical protein
MAADGGDEQGHRNDHHDATSDAPHRPRLAQGSDISDAVQGTSIAPLPRPRLTWFTNAVNEHIVARMWQR